MWIFCAFIITSVVGSAFTEKSDDITVKCVSCKDGGSSLEGAVGENLTIRYTINKAEFGLFAIYVNSTKNKIIATNGGVINKIGISERFIVPSVVKKGDSRTLKFTLTKLSLPDNGFYFKYVYTDSEAKEFTDTAKVTVSATSKKLTSDDDVGNTTAIIIIVIVVVIILIIAILVLLYKKGIIPTDGCLGMCGGRERVSTQGDNTRLQEDDGDRDDMKKYVVDSQGHTPTEYAELGPGGRLNIPYNKPEKSMYAEVKTEDVHYPDPKYAEPASVIV